MIDPLLFSRRRMLNRLSFQPQDVHGLLDPIGQTLPSAMACLLDLEARGLAARGSDRGLEPGWLITDAGVIAMAENGVIYVEDAGR